MKDLRHTNDVLTSRNEALQLEVDSAAHALKRKILTIQDLEEEIALIRTETDAEKDDLSTAVADAELSATADRKAYGVEAAKRVQQIEILTNSLGNAESELLRLEQVATRTDAAFAAFRLKAEKERTALHEEAGRICNRLQRSEDERQALRLELDAAKVSQIELSKAERDARLSADTAASDAVAESARWHARLVQAIAVLDENASDLRRATDAEASHLWARLSDSLTSQYSTTGTDLRSLLACTLPCDRSP